MYTSSSLYLLFTCRQKMFQNFWQQAFTNTFLHKIKVWWSFNEITLIQLISYWRILYPCCIAQIMSHHDGWVQWGEIKSRNGITIITFNRFYNSGSSKMISNFNFQSRNDKIMFYSLKRNEYIWIIIFNFIKLNFTINWMKLDKMISWR